MSPSVQNHSQGTIRAASIISLLAGIWLFISPWLYSAHSLPNAWNSWIVGGLIVILAAIRVSYPTANVWMSWLNCLFGAWVFVSPWVYGYAGATGRLVNSLCVGVIVFVVAIRSATATPHPPLATQ